IVEQRVKVNQKARILELKRINPEENGSDNLYVEMDDLGINMKEYVQRETERALKNGKVYNWDTPTYGKIGYDKDVQYLKILEAEFPAIVYDDGFTFEL
ncbi:hypothetical protein Tco_1019116, partial [Tanacetum coccineum]